MSSDISCSSTRTQRNALQPFMSNDLSTPWMQYTQDISHPNSLKSLQGSLDSLPAGMDETERALLLDFVIAASTTPTPPSVGGYFTQHDDYVPMSAHNLPSLAVVISPLHPYDQQAEFYDELVQSLPSPGLPAGLPPVVGRCQRSSAGSDHFVTPSLPQYDDNVYDCEWSDCHDSFKSLDSLCRHLTQGHLVQTQAPFHCLWRSCERHPNAKVLQNAACSAYLPTSAIVDAEPKSKETFRPFPKRNKLVMHVRTHTGERPFHCDECGRGFARADGLASHRKRHEQKAPSLSTVAATGRARRSKRLASTKILSLPTSLPSVDEAPAHPEAISTGFGLVDEATGVLFGQDLLRQVSVKTPELTHIAYPVTGSNPTPPGWTIVESIHDAFTTPLNASTQLDMDAAWWAATLAEEHFQAMMRHEASQNPTGQLDFMTPASDAVLYAHKH